MGRNGPPFDQDKSAKGKKTTLRGSFDGLDVAMGLVSAEKDGEDGTGGAGGESATKGPHKSFAESARRAGVEQEETVIEKGGVSVEDTHGGEVANAPESALYPGPDMLSTDSPPPIVVARPRGSSKSSRDRARQARGGKGGDSAAVDITGPDTQDAAPSGLFGGKGDKSAEMQAHIDNEALIQGARSFDELYAAVDAIGSFQGSSDSYTAQEIKERIELARSDARNLNKITRAHGLRGAVERLLQEQHPVDPEEGDMVQTSEGDASETADAEGEPITDPTLKESKVAMREGVAKVEMESLKRQEGVVKAAQDKYFDALAQHQKNRGSLTVIAENFTGDLGGPKELKALRKAWIQARAGHAFAQQAALNARLEGRPKTKEEILDGLQRYKGKSSLDQIELRKRYERMVTVRSVVVGAEEAERQVSAEALNSRDKKTFEKMNDWWQNKVPPSVRIFGTSAILFGGAALLAGNPIGLAALGMAGVSPAVRYWANKANGPILKNVLGTTSRFLSVAGAFGALADYGVRLGHHIAGTEKEAAALLAQREGLGNLTSMKNLEHISKERKKALAAKETIARHGRLAGILTSIGAGWLFGHVGPGSHHAPADGADETTTNDGAAADKPDTASATRNVDKAPAAVSADAAPAAPAHPTTPDGLLGQPAVIDASGEGFGQLVVDLKQSMASVENPSPALKHFLDTNVNQLNHDILAAKDGMSLTMHPGDRAFFDNDQNMWVQRQGGEPQLVFENSPTAPGGFIEHDIHGPMKADIVHHEAPKVEAVAAPAPTVEAPVTTPPAPAEAAVSQDAGVTVSAGQEAGAPPSGDVVITSTPDLSNNGVEVTPGGSIAPESAVVSGDAPPQPEQAPVTPPAPAPAPVEQAPVAAPVPEARVEIPHTPAEALTGGVAFTNGHNIEITPTTPEIYFSPTANGEVGYMYGGPGDTAFKAAQQYVEDNPGTSIRFFALDPEGKAVTGAFFSDASGASHPMIVDPTTDQPFASPDLEAVTRKVDFNYRPVR